MTWKVLITAPYFQPIVDQYRGVFAENDIEIVVPPVNERMSEEELLVYIEDIDGVISGDDRFTTKVFEKATKLKVVSKWGTGIDSIDAQGARRFGVRVMNTPGAFTNPVSDSVLGYMLCFARNIPWMDRDMRRGLWHKRMGVSLRESTLGIIGVGDIGKAVARRARPFGMRLLGHDIAEIEPSFLDETGMEMMACDQLLQQADFISLNCTLSERSFHIIDKDALSLMKNSAFLINTARGPLIDGDALADALEANAIAGAALDVFEQEPLPDDSRLKKLDNCLLAPHNSNSSPEAWQRVHENTLKNLLDVLHGRLK